MLELKLVGAHFNLENVSVLSKLLNGVYRMLDLEEQLAQLVVYYAGNHFHLQDICGVDAYVKQTQIRLLVVSVSIFYI